MSTYVFAPTVGYASLATARSADALDLLNSWCRQLSGESEILAEEILPTELNRPLWNKIMIQIELGTVKTVIVPSLFHLAGGNMIALSHLLSFFDVHGVNLKSLAEVIDSRRISKNDIVLQLIEDLDSNRNNRGV
jgi:DNA invertase Pin-like site-specific DNA recombinase